jgi:N-dimethylarginine dimethylaminohydrolase
MSVWTEFNPLKSCVIGTIPEPKKILPFTKLKNRYEKYFTEILDRSRHELDDLEKTIQSFGVTTFRSRQDYPIHNGKTINTPPLAVRDIFSVYGDNLFKGNFAFEWNKEVPKSCDSTLSAINFDGVTQLPTEDIFYNGDFANFDPELDLPRPMFHPPMSLRIGNDIVIAKHYAKEGNTLGRQSYERWLQSVNPQVRFHVVDAESHLDSQIFIVRPGLMLTCLDDRQLPDYFDNWEKIHVESVTSQLMHKTNENRHKKFHPVIAQWFYNFLETCTEETYFNLNSLSINESTVLFTGLHPELFKKLEKKGITCVPVQMKATTFWDTGVHCVTNEIERAGELTDYA